jgi:8-oxo-dGTP pyrophosphatase MutT (NUDIX family)
VLELDESLPDCVVREVREETGLTVKPVRLVGVYSSPDFDVTYPNGDQVQQITACFDCVITNGQALACDAETLELAWYDLQVSPPSATWYRAMAADLAAERTAASFDRGSAGDSQRGGPFYQWIRRHIGTAPFVMPASAAFIQNRIGDVLLQRRADTGGWGLPGGAVELGERVDRTVIHEVEEETGLKVVPERLIGVYSDDGFWYEYPNGDQVKVVSMLFGCRAVGGSLCADGIESLEVRFFPVDALPDMAERHARRVRDALAQRNAAFF